MMASLLAPVEVDEEDMALGRQLLAAKSAEEIAAALVRSVRAALPQPEELIEGSAQSHRAPAQDGPRPGFEDVVWFRMDIGRRQNADPRWLLPLLCRRGHITKNEIGAIRIAPNETRFQVPRAIAGKFAEAVARSADAQGEDESGVRIEPSEAPPPQAPRVHRKGGSNADGPPQNRARIRPAHGAPHRGKPGPKGKRPR
jgi:ATP-dependent RNA helicase DeaD